MLVELEATEDTWVSVKTADGTPILAELLPKGRLRSISVDPGATLRAGNAAGLMIKLDGKPLGSLGPPGGVRDVTFFDGDFTIKKP